MTTAVEEEIEMKNPIFGFSRARFVCLMSVCVSLSIATGCAEKSNRTTKVTVAGEAVARVEPDTAVLTVSVVTQSTQAVNAQQEDARKSQAGTAAAGKTAGSGVEVKISDYTLLQLSDFRY